MSDDMGPLPSADARPPCAICRHVGHPTAEHGEPRGYDGAGRFLYEQVVREREAWKMLYLRSAWAGVESGDAVRAIEPAFPDQATSPNEAPPPATLDRAGWPDPDDGRPWGGR